MNYNGNSGQGEAASYYASAQQSYQNNQYQQQGQQEDSPTGDRGVLGAIGGGIAGGFGGNKLGNKTGHSKLGTILGAVAGAVAGHKVQDGVEDWKDKRDEEKEKKQQEEEAAKRREEEDRRRREEEDKRRNEQQQQQQHYHAPAPHHNTNYAGNFSGSSNDIRLDEAGGEWRLTASCRRTDGCYQSSSLSLNQILENNQGSFQWASGGGDCRPHDSHCGPNTYTVQSGDTLRDIACRFPGKTWQEFAQVNNIANPDLIHPGLVLQIPGGAPSGGASGNFAASARNIRLADNGRRLEADLLRNGQYCNASIVLDERIGNENGCLKYKN